MFSKLLTTAVVAIVVGSIVVDAASGCPSGCQQCVGDCCMDADSGLCGAASCPGNGLAANNNARVPKSECTTFNPSCTSQKCLGQTASTRTCIWKNGGNDAFACDKCLRTNAGYCNGRATAEPMGSNDCACVCQTGYAGDATCGTCSAGYVRVDGDCVATPGPTPVPLTPQPTPPPTPPPTPTVARSLPPRTTSSAPSRASAPAPTAH